MKPPPLPEPTPSIPVESHPDPDRLPESLGSRLRALGRVPAPAELWQRVALSLDERAPAPSQLWDRVAAELRRDEFQPRPALAIRGRRLAAAAALLLVGGLAFLASRGEPAVPEQPAMAYETRIALRDYYLSRAIAIELGPGQSDQLSPTARALAGALGSTHGRGDRL